MIIVVVREMSFSYSIIHLGKSKNDEAAYLNARIVSA